jgi:hypothetical protein
MPSVNHGLVIPKPGDIVRCKFHFQDDPSQFKFRYCLVIAVTESETLAGVQSVMVAYGTSQNTAFVRNDEVLISEADKTVFPVSGLQKTTKFSLSKTEMVDLNRDNFIVSPGGRLSVGVLHPSKVHDVAHAWEHARKLRENRFEFENVAKIRPR